MHIISYVTDDGRSVTLPYTDDNIAIAGAEASGGAYTVSDSGDDPPATVADQVAELHDALDLLLSGYTNDT